MLNHVSDNDTARYIIIEVYKNHPSVTKIKQIFGKNTITNSFTFHSIAQSHVATLLKQTDIKKTAGLEKIQPNLVNLLVSILYGSLTKTINVVYFHMLPKLLLCLQLIRILAKN